MIGLMFWIGFIALILSYWIPQYSEALSKTGWTLIIFFLVIIMLKSLNEVLEERRIKKESEGGVTK